MSPGVDGEDQVIERVRVLDEQITDWCEQWITASDEVRWFLPPFMLDHPAMWRDLPREF